MHAVVESIIVCNVENAHKQLVYESNRQWNEIIQSKPKLRTYILLKNDVFIEQYVKYYMSKRSCSLFAKFRLGILALFVETGRYDNTPLPNRLCK